MTTLLIFLPSSSRVVGPCVLSQGTVRRRVGLKKQKRGIPVVFNPLCCLKEVIKSLQSRVTSRWQRRGECLHSPWCPSTPGTDPSGSAGHARHSHSAPAPHRTWWHTEGIRGRAKTQMSRNSCSPDLCLCTNSGALPKQYYPHPPPPLSTKPLLFNHKPSLR